MKEDKSFIVFALVLFLLLLSGIGCHLIFPLSPSNYATQPPYYCTAQIYRDLPSGQRFTEQYNTYLWPKYDWDQDGQIDSDDAYILCSDKIEGYIDEYMAPGFVWNKQSITVTAANMRMAGTDCSDVSPVSPVYGGQWGSALSWQDPDGNGPDEIPPDRAYVWVRMTDADGVDHIAEPYVEHALVTLAESTGLRDSFGVYDPSVRHVRIAHMEIDLRNSTSQMSGLRTFMSTISEPSPQMEPAPWPQSSLNLQSCSCMHAEKTMMDQASRANVF